jgi:hypothetical protein
VGEGDAPERHAELFYVSRSGWRALPT